jgi:hypothetical protein
MVVAPRVAGLEEQDVKVRKGKGGRDHAEDDSCENVGHVFAPFG